MKKKILSLLLALLMVGSSAAMTAAEETLTTTAASENATHVASAEFLKEFDIMKGLTEDDLGLENPIKRYEMALFVSRIATGWTDDLAWSLPGSPVDYTDLEGSGAINSIGAIAYATEEGIIQGYGNGKFGPEDGITYQDALTMAVRTLGYKDLKWPWGFIEKAIELNITEGVTEKSYTETLNRAEVAQIVYNTLFAATKDNTTLAAKNFGMEWKTIIVTASDRAVFEEGANYTKSGWITFKTYEPASAKLGTQVYYVETAELGLVDVNDDERAVGRTFQALVHTDKNGNIVVNETVEEKDGKAVYAYETIIDYYQSETETFVNADKVYNIADAFLGTYSMKTKYTVGTYGPNGTKPDAYEILVYTDKGQDAPVVVFKNGVAIDWNTGDILVACTQFDDYKYQAADGTFYKVAWYWNAKLEKYYRFQMNSNNGLIGYDFMEEDEYKATIDEARKGMTTDGKKGFSLLSSLANKGTAYAEVVVESVDVAHKTLNAYRGFYEEYGLGYIELTVDKCVDCDANQTHYIIYNVKDEMYKGEESDGTISGLQISTGTVKQATYKVSTCAHGAWFDEASDKDLVKDGSYIIYGYNTATGELDIEKVIGDGSDADSYIGYGVLRAYSPSKQKIVVDNELLPIDYDNLINTGFKETHKNVEKYLEGFEDLLNNVVEYVVVDGSVVAINLKSQDIADRFIVIQEFVDFSIDGYIGVDAFNATTGAFGRYYINSYNSWEKGSYYYGKEERVEKAFAAGNLFYIKNVTNDEKSPLYDVELVGMYNEEGVYTIDTAKVKLTNTTITFNEEGLKVVNNGSASANNNTYVVIPETLEGYGKAPIYVYTAPVNDLTWSVSGNTISSITASHVFVGAKDEDVNGFNLDAHLHGLFLYEGGYYKEYASTVGAVDQLFGANAGRYIETERKFTVELVDLYTGNTTLKSLVAADFNKDITDMELHSFDFEDGHVYVTIGNKIVCDLTAEYDINVVDAMANVYYQDRYMNKFGTVSASSADYLIDTFVPAATVVTVDDVKKAIADKYFEGADKYVKMNDEANKVLEQFVVTTTEEGVELTAITADTDTTGLVYTYVFDVKNGSVVVYAAEVVEAPVETEPVETEPVETEPVETDPVETDPVETDPVETDPVETDPVETDPVETDPVETEPVEVADVTITLTDASAAAGEQVVITVSMSSTTKSNTLGLNKLTYDESVFTFVSFYEYDEEEDEIVYLDVMEGATLQELNNEKKIVGMGYMKPKKLEGDVCVIILDVNSEAAAGSYEITFGEVITKLDSDVLVNSIVPATVTIG